MTTNQTIDGVSRELIEKAMLACFEAGRGITHDELRALLEAPAVPSKFVGAAQYWSENEQALRDACKFEGLKGLVYQVVRDCAKPAAQPQGVLVSRELIERISSRLNETGQFLLSEELHATVAESAPIIGGEVDRLNGMLDAASELLRTKQRANRELRSELERIKAINDNNFKLVLDRLFEPSAPVVDGQDDQQMACMPVERCHDVRAKMIIAFNEARENGGDLDCALDAAYKAALRYSPNPLSAEQPAPVAVVALTQDAIDRIVPSLNPEPDRDEFHCEWALWSDRERIRGKLSTLLTANPAPVAVAPKSECPNCLGDAMFGCDACTPDPVAVVLPARPRADEEEYERMTDYEKGLLHGGIELWDKIDEATRLNTK